MSVDSVLKTCILPYYRLETDGEIMLCNISLLLSRTVFNVHAQRPTDK